MTALFRELFETPSYIVMKIILYKQFAYPSTEEVKRREKIENASKLLALFFFD